VGSWESKAEGTMVNSSVPPKLNREVKPAEVSLEAKLMLLSFDALMAIKMLIDGKDINGARESSKVGCGFSKLPGQRSDRGDRVMTTISDRYDGLELQNWRLDKTWVQNPLGT